MSPEASIPRSPWVASAAWRKWACVPVERSVAAILRAMMPLLPIPVMMMRLALADWRSRSAVWVKGASRVLSRRSASSLRAAASTRTNYDGRRGWDEIGALLDIVLNHVDASRERVRDIRGAVES